MIKVKKRLHGWTLTELLIVLAIIGILVLLVLPNQTAVISKAKSKEAQLQLNAFYSFQLTHFYEFSKYSDDFEEIGFVQEKLTTEGGQANYRIEIVEFSPNAYRARAVSVVDFDNDGTYNVWEIDQDKNLKEIVKD
jgi:type IV pilus assembly protein PilE